MQRFGQVIRLKPGAYEEYKRWHKAIWPEIAKVITDCNIRNYSIYTKDGICYAYFEYHGKDFDGDMAKMAADPKTQEWWAIQKPLQEPVATAAPGEWWSTMEEIFHQD